MIKHVGRHNDKKVVVLFRKVPNASNFCLLVYSDLLPRTYHDAVMRVLESDVGQQAKEFSDALHRNLLTDGRNILEVLHKEGLIHKIQTSQVIITPDVKSSCRLDELNNILDKIDGGAGEALAEQDANAGMYDPKKKKVMPDAIRTTSADVTGEVPQVMAAAPVADSTLANIVDGAAIGEPVVAVDAKQTPAQLMQELKEGIKHVKQLEAKLRTMRAR